MSHRQFPLLAHGAFRGGAFLPPHSVAVDEGYSSQLAPGFGVDAITPRARGVLQLVKPVARHHRPSKTRLRIDAGSPAATPTSAFRSLNSAAR